MTKISSSNTFIVKRLFPILWFGFIGVFLVAAVATGFFKEAPPVLMAPIVMAVFGFFLFRLLVWNLADEVYDAGDDLLIKKGGQEDRIPLSNIMNIGYSKLNQQQVTLRFVAPTKFGMEVSFMPVIQIFSPFKNKMIEDLITRVYAARPKR